jgi:hypothetical protein
MEELGLMGKLLRFGEGTPDEPEAETGDLDDADDSLRGASPSVQLVLE